MRTALAARPERWAAAVATRQGGAGDGARRARDALARGGSGAAAGGAHACHATDCSTPPGSSSPAGIRCPGANGSAAARRAGAALARRAASRGTGPGADLRRLLGVCRGARGRHHPGRPGGDAARPPGLGAAHPCLQRGAQAPLGDQGWRRPARQPRSGVGAAALRRAEATTPARSAQEPFAADPTTFAESACGGGLAGAAGGGARAARGRRARRAAGDGQAGRRRAGAAQDRSWWGASPRRPRRRPGRPAGGTALRWPTGGLAGEAAAAARALVAQGRALAGSRVALVLGGETTVTLGASPGRGGRNQELLWRRRSGSRRAAASVVLALATDGEDGPTPLPGPSSTAPAGRRSSAPAPARGRARRARFAAGAGGVARHPARHRQHHNSVGDLAIYLRWEGGVRAGRGGWRAARMAPDALVI